MRYPGFAKGLLFYLMLYFYSSYDDLFYDDIPS